MKTLQEKVEIAMNNTSIQAAIYDATRSTTNTANYDAIGAFTYINVEYITYSDIYAAICNITNAATYDAINAI